MMADNFCGKASLLEVNHLISKGQRYVATFLAEECRKAKFDEDGRPILRMLPAILNYFLNLQDQIPTDVTIDWVRFIMAGDQTPTEFCNEVKKYNVSSTCGLVWTANFVAYRCRTCSVSPCMSICASCFQEADHTDHDYNMFKSLAGGACDCGNPAVMKESGFCKNHGGEKGRNITLPEDLCRVPRAVLPIILQRIILCCRDSSEKLMHTTDVLFGCAPLLNYLKEFISLGSGARLLLREALCSRSHYKDLAPKAGDLNFAEKEKSEINYKLQRDSMVNIQIPPDFGVAESMLDPLIHDTYLEELIFWTVRFEFPLRLVYFLLNMKPDPIYEEAFATSFVRHYSRMSRTLTSCKATDPLSNSVVHITVQLFSDDSLAFKMVDQCSLLHILVLSIRSMMESVLVKSQIHALLYNRHKVVECTSFIMKNHCYWPLVSDLNNILSHRPIVEKFLTDKKLISTWYQFVSLFQGMNANVRELNTHVEYESDTYMAAFSAESEVSATPLWAIVSHLKTPDTRHCTQMALSACYERLEKWIHDIGLSSQPYLDDEYIVSFHTPLHRNYALLICYLVKYQRKHIEDVLPSAMMFEKICYHPIATLAGAAEIANDLWLRNGYQIKGNPSTYMQYHFCNYMVDLDLFLLQLAASEPQHNQLLDMILKRFHVFDLLTYGPKIPKIQRLDTDQINSSIESFLTVLAQLVTTRTYLGDDDEAIRKLDMITLLCASDRTHSQVFDHMPDKGSPSHTSEEDEDLLKSISLYHPPVPDQNMKMVPGTYYPKNEVWEKLYDPVHAALRLVNKKDNQNSMDRFRQFYCEKHNISKSDCRVWPPYRLPAPINTAFKDPRRVLANRAFHSVLLSLLFKMEREHLPSERTLSLVIYLLELVIEYQALSFKEGATNVSSINRSLEASHLELHEEAFHTWYQTDDIFTNSMQVVTSVRLKKSDKPEDVSMQSGSATVEGAMDFDFEVIDSIEESSVPQARSVASGSEIVPFHFSSSALVSSNPVRPSDYNMPVPRNSLFSGLANHELNRFPLELLKRRSSQPVCLEGSPQYSDYLSIITDDCDQWEYTDGNRHIFNESIITLLLKLHAKVKFKKSHYMPNFVDPIDDSRIGDGAFFIGNVLNRLGRYSLPVQDEIRKQLSILYPNASEEKFFKKDEKESRRSAAKARMAKITRDFQSKQKKFLKKNDPVINTTNNINSVQDKDYFCVICNENGASTLDKPVALIAMTQATSALGWMRGTNEPLNLPLNEEQHWKLLHSESTLAQIVRKRAEILRGNFDLASCLLSMNNGWEGGVHVQACGHHVHLKCYHTYTDTLRNNARDSHQDNTRFTGEYKCPCCRKFVNAIIPLTPELGGNSAVAKFDPSRDERECIDKLLSELSIPELKGELTQAMAKLMEDLTVATYAQYRTTSSSRNSASLFMFVSSIARTNLETELAARGGDLVLRSSSFDRRVRSSCLLALLHTLSVHAKILTGGCAISTKDPVPWITQVWMNLTSRFVDDSEVALSIHDKSVPLLFKDPMTVLIQLILLLPIRLEERFVNCILFYVYRLAVVRCILSVFTCRNRRTRNLLCQKGILSPLFAMVNYYLSLAPIYTNESDDAPTETAVIDATNEVQEYCLTFLRTTSLLIASMRECDLPFIQTASDECETLEKFIGVYDSCSVINSKAIENLCAFGSGGDLWLGRKQNSSLFIACGTWCSEIERFASDTPIAASQLTTLHRFFPPRLLRLPQCYDDVFRFYYDKQCMRCRSVPKDPAICLVCGTLVCLREKCCRENETFEGKRHAIDCGAGTSVFLAVSQCKIIVIRGNGVCHWGCVYLDEFGEDDEDLKRGRKLHLSTPRFELLEQVWINHTFDNYSTRKWKFPREGY